MESFEELGVDLELVDALTAEGIEIPTEFQAAAIPVLLRGNPLLGQASAGAGTLVAYGIPLLQRVDPDAQAPRALVMAASVETASRLASSLSQLARSTGHQVRALAPGWALPERATILFSTPEDLLRAVGSSRISLDGAEAVVVDGFGALESQGRDALKVIFESLPKEAQRVLLAQPLSGDAEAFGRAHLSRAVHVPPRAALGPDAEAPPRRGEVSYRIASEGKEEELIQTVSHELGRGAHHALLFFRTEDAAADFGDLLGLHGFQAGAPGEAEFPVWLATDELQARRVLDEWSGPAEVVTVSVGVPADPDSLDRRHGGGETGTVLLHSRELPHLKGVARRTGYRLVPAQGPIPTRIAGEMDRLRTLLDRTLREEELSPYYLAVEPLFRSYSPAEVAAAALALLKRGSLPREKDPGEERGAREPLGGPPPKAWMRLFVAVGERDGVGPGDLLGAIAGEAGVEGSQVGKIEIRDTYSLVEVAPQVADTIIRRLNGTSIRGRAVRVDHDRGGPRSRGGGGSRGKRKPRGDSAP